MTGEKQVAHNLLARPAALRASFLGYWRRGAECGVGVCKKAASGGGGGGVGCCVPRPHIHTYIGSAALCPFHLPLHGHPEAQCNNRCKHWDGHPVFISITIHPVPPFHPSSELAVRVRELIPTEHRRFASKAHQRTTRRAVGSTHPTRHTPTRTGTKRSLQTMYR